MAIAGVTTVLYVLAMFAFYDADTYVYMSGSCILSQGTVNWYQLFINVYRTVVGIGGSVAFMSVLYLISNKLHCNDKAVKGLAALGTMTMGMYCFQDYFWILYRDYVTWYVKPSIVNQLLMFVLSFLVSFALTWLVRRVKVLNMLFLGGR